MPQKYRVTAPSKVFGTPPGKSFERDIPPVQEERLLASGAIEKVSGKKPPAVSSTTPPKPSFGNDDKE